VAVKTLKNVIITSILKMMVTAASEMFILLYPTTGCHTP